MSEKYNHKEAFCLMSYKCEKCHDVEILWNSRDGVTPFIIGCTKCNGSMKHILWVFDKCVPNYRPEKGMRIFKSHTLESYKKGAKEYAQNLWDKNIHGARERYKSAEELYKVVSNDFQEGQPYVHKVE